jgi:hypothetical protein
VRIARSSGQRYGAEELAWLLVLSREQRLLINRQKLGAARRSMSWMKTARSTPMR